MQPFLCAFLYVRYFFGSFLQFCPNRRLKQTVVMTITMRRDRCNVALKTGYQLWRLVHYFIFVTMKKASLITVLTVLVFSATAQPGYNIDITLKPFRNQKVYLGYHYGKAKALTDSAVLDNNSKGVFSGEKTLAGGIYFVVSPNKEILFELLIDKQQRFAIEADTANLPSNVRFLRSPDNSSFQQYTVFASRAGRESARLTAAYKTSGNPADSVKNTVLIRDLSKSMDKFRDSVVQNNLSH
ncbi:MAG: DUF4369 domain-containing protein [Chitinophagaceae bacterium]|nr:MAG: DUF4369 domain-containing protein [Chitinophagaceae bacterium]